MIDGELRRMFRGDTHILDFLITDDYGPLDLTTYDLRFTAKYSDRDTDDEAVIVKTLDYGGITLGAGIGTATVTIDPEDTDDLPKTTRLAYDFQVSDTFGSVMTPIRGSLLVMADVSRSAP